MPKQVSTLVSSVVYKKSGQGKGFQKYRLRMNFGDPHFSYKKNRWVNLKFESIVRWRIDAATMAYNGAGALVIEQMPKIIVITLDRHQREEERVFAFHPLQFEDHWLYFILRGILQYSNVEIPEEYLDGLPAKLKLKVSTRLKIKTFDNLHGVFVNIVKNLEEGEADVKPTGLSKPVRSPDAIKFDIEGPQVVGVTKSGMKYGSVLSKIGKGGSNTVIFEIKKMLKPILTKDSDKGGLKIVWDSEPMVAKTAMNPWNMAGDLDCSGIEDIIKEARVLASLGKHRNIVGLIDAHVYSTQQSGFRIFLFLERGYNTLEDFQKHKQRLKPPQIRKYVKGILSGIDHMHKCRTYHLDMKPENVIICKADIPKIIDFGLSKNRIFYDSKKAMFDEKWDIFGTKGYIAPESLTLKWKSLTNINEADLSKRDSYAVGMTIFDSLLAPYFRWPEITLKSILAEGLPQIKKRIAHWQKYILQESVRRNLASAGLLEIADAASALINEDPTLRPTIGEIYQMLMVFFTDKRKSLGKHSDLSDLSQLRDQIHLDDSLKKLRGEY